MGTSIVVGDDLERIGPYQGHLGGGRAAVDTEDVLGIWIKCAAHGLGVPDQFGGRIQWRIELVTAMRLVAHQRLHGRQLGAPIAGQAGSAKGLEPWGLFRDHKIDVGPGLAQECDQEVVAGDPADQRHLAFHQARLDQEVRDLVGHDPAQRQCDVALGGFALVEPVGAVRLHEHAAAGAQLVHAGVATGTRCALQVQVHPAHLLAEELAGAGGALVARPGVDDPPVLVQAVQNQVLTAHGHDGVGLERQRRQTRLDRLCSDHRADGEPMSTLVAGHQHPRAIARLHAQVVEQAPDRSRHVTVVRDEALFAESVVAQLHQLDVGRADVDSQSMNVACHTLPRSSGRLCIFAAGCPKK